MSATATAWGISSTQFALWYAGLCVALWAANVMAWRWAAGNPDNVARPFRELDRYELAMLHGGPPLAATTALAALHERGLLDTSASLLVAADDTPVDADPLERAVIEAARARPVLATYAVEHDPGCRAAIDRLAATMTGHGLLVAPERARRARLLWLYGPVVLVLLGAARLATAWDYGDQAFRYLLILVLLTTGMMLFHITAAMRSDRRPLPTAWGSALLTRRRNLGPGRLDGERLALAVALSGAQELWKHDPALASALGVRREQAVSNAQNTRANCASCG